MSIYFNNLIRSLCLCFAFVLGSFTAQGQTSIFNVLDKSDGLPSNFVYRVLEDMDGYIWICTNNGVCKYDGKDMKCFDLTDGLPDKDIFKITLDEIGRLWLIHASNKIAFIQNDSVHVIPTASVASIQRQYYNYGARQGIQIGEEFHSIAGDNSVKKDTASSNHFYANNLIWHDLHLTSPTNPKTEITEFIVFDLNGNLIKILSEIVVEEESICQYHQPSNTFQIYNGNRLYIYDSLLNYQEVLEIDLPNDLDVFSALKDRWGNLWVCTRNGLFFQSYNQRIHQISFHPKVEDSNIINILNHNEGAIVIDDDGSIYKFVLNELQLLNKREINNTLIYNVELRDDELYMSSGQFGLERMDVSVRSEYNFEHLISGTKKIVLTNKDEMFSCGNQLRVVDVKTNKYKSINKKYYKEIAYDYKNEDVWISTNDSLFIFENRENIKLKMSILFPLIENIKYVGNGKTIVTTFDSHVYICDNDACNEVELNNNAHVKSIKVYDEKVWLNTNSGIYTTEESISDSIEISFILYFDFGPLQNNVIVNDILIKDEQILLGTENGLITINELKVPKTEISIPISIDNVNGKKVEANEFTFKYDERNILIEYKAKYFGNRNQLSYEYYLEGNNNSDIVRLYKEEVRFNNLESGNYVFRVRAVDSFGNVSAFKELKIKIEKPWYHRPSVYISGFLILLVLGYLVFKFYLSRVQKKTALQQQFAELELSALQSQMNPHFVFNAMNSIQNLITSNRPEEADLYVTRLATLMRKYLNNSREKYIRIDEEIEIVLLYVELEQLRFGKKISYHIDNRLDSQYASKLVPATIIQPFVENSLKHGLFHKKTEGNLYLRLYNDNINIYIEIEDDGVGRRRVKEIHESNRRNHMSTGMKSIESKLEVLRKLDKLDVEYSIIDLYNEKVASGTKVIIRMSI